jgi:simple sugar transport system permease protein
VALFLHGLPSPLLLLVMFLAGFMGGGLLAAFCGLLRARLGINEIVTTLLMNYVVGLWVGYFVHGPWQAPDCNVPETIEFVAAAQLPIIISDTRVHLGVLVVLACALACHYFLGRSVWGYRIRVCGDNAKAARMAGIDFKRSVLLVMLLSGGLAGAGGMLEVSGAIHRLQDGASPFFTMTVFMVAWVARLNWAGILVAGFLISGLQVGGYYMQFMGLPSALISVIEGAMLFCLIGFEPLRLYMLKRAGKGA